MQPEANTPSNVSVKVGPPAVILIGFTLVIVGVCTIRLAEPEGGRDGFTTVMLAVVGCAIKLGETRAVRDVVAPLKVVGRTFPLN
jgi:hypothetical protein